MNLSDAVSAMRDTALFRHVDDKRLKVVAMVGETLSYRPGERIFERGDDGDAAYIVIDGAVDVLAQSEGIEKKVARLGRGEIFGEIAVLCNLPRTTAIAASEELTVLRLGRDELLRLLREFPDVALEMIRILGERLAATTERLAAIR
ncbi:MAG: cyclic nucleotide-binding domain-containing protein [Pseudomonadota bacterium]